jgi:enoyl-CoA hydratase/carnithine racemase
VDYTTVTYELADHVATVTLNRPDRMNAFNERMQYELNALWKELQHNDDVRVVILTGAGERAFCSGVDRTESGIPSATAELASGFTRPWTYQDVGDLICPKTVGLWKPFIAAVNGIACGGAFYLLGESDVIIAAETATFFDPHVTYGQTAVFEPMQMLHRLPFNELLRMTLVGSGERVSAARAYQVGFVTEVVAPTQLLDAARQVARTIAASPPRSVEGSLRALWTARELSRQQALDLGYLFVAHGNTQEVTAAGQAAFSSGQRQTYRVR